MSNFASMKKGPFLKGPKTKGEFAEELLSGFKCETLVLKIQELAIQDLE